MSEPALEQAPFRLGFRVCDRRFPFLWESPGQQSGRWNRAGDLPVHYLASTPLVAWAEWLRHQEIEVAEDLAGIAATLWALLIPAAWGPEDLPAVELPLRAEVLLLWCPADHLAGWCCVPEGRPGPELLPLVRREGMLPG